VKGTLSNGVVSFQGIPFAATLRGTNHGLRLRAAGMFLAELYRVLRNRNRNVSAVGALQCHARPSERTRSKS
jgi:hypothetical protein